MLVNRVSIVAKVGNSPKLIPLMEEFVEWLNHPHAIRILSPEIGESNLFVWGTGYESLTEMEKLNEEMVARPEFFDFNEIILTILGYQTTPINNSFVFVVSIYFLDPVHNMCFGDYLLTMPIFLVNALP